MNDQWPVRNAAARQTSPKQAATIVAALKAQVQTVDAGHAMMSEAPDAVLAAVRGALR